MSSIGSKIYPGRTFHLQAPDSPKPHLYIVLTWPDGEPERVVIVNFTTRHDYSDLTVVLNIGDHRFINRETVVAYQFAMSAQVSDIQKAIRAGVSAFDDDCSDDLLEKIQLGLLASPLTGAPIKAYCKKRFDF